MGKQFWSREEGFTLIELITVIVILGILGATIIVRYEDYSTRVKANACRSNQIALEKAQVMCYASRALVGAPTYAEELNELMPFLTSATMPQCPDGGSYTLNTDGTITCSLPSHSRGK